VHFEIEFWLYAAMVMTVCVCVGGGGVCEGVCPLQMPPRSFTGFGSQEEDDPVIKQLFAVVVVSGP